MRLGDRARHRAGMVVWLYTACLVGCTGAAAGDGTTWVVEEASGLLSDLEDCDCSLADPLTSQTGAEEIILSCYTGRGDLGSISISLPMPPTNHLRGVVFGSARVDDVYTIDVTAVAEMGSYVEAKIHDKTEYDSSRHPYRVVHLHALATPTSRACSFFDSTECVDLPEGRLTGYRGFCDAISFDHEHNANPRPK